MRPPKRVAAAVVAAAVAVGAAVARARILLVAPRDSYRTAPYIAAARKQGVDLLIASEGKHTLSGLDAPGIQVDLRDASGSLQAVLAAAQAQPFVGVIGTDDASTEFAVQTSLRLQLPHNPPESVHLARRKDLARCQLARAGVPVPRHWKLDLARPLAAQLTDVIFPCVIKPVALSASRGVIRANDHEQLEKAVGRIARMLSDVPDRDERETLLIEEFIAGNEVAVEGLLRGGRLEILAVFDKPDPLDGPYFEETYYTTPSRLASDIQTQIAARVAEACAAYGLREGPVHAECRINAAGVWILEVAARTIGGLCGRLLRFGTGYGLEELVLLHTLGQHPDTRREAGGAGVLMIPIPQAGILRRVEGVLAAQRVTYIEEVVIDVREGYELVPLPEGSSYLGFIFARAPSPAEAEAALRAAHACLRVVVAPLWKGGLVSAVAS
jgi:biotin carboxylase